MTRSTTLTGPRPLALDLATPVEPAPAEPAPAYYFHPERQVSITADGTPRTALETAVTMTVNHPRPLPNDERDYAAGSLW